MLRASDRAPGLALGDDVVLPHDVEIGANVVIHPGTTIGTGVRIQDGAVLGKPLALGACRWPLARSRRRSCSATR